MSETAEVVLVSMPWSTIRSPSIQIGSIKALLRGHDVAAETASFNLLLFDYLANQASKATLTYQEYEWFEHTGWSGLCEWIFRIPPLEEQLPDGNEYRKFLASHFAHFFENQGGVDLWFQHACAIRDALPGYIDECVSQVLAMRPAVVGFTATFFQTVPSLLLSKRLKQERRELTIVFGGSNCGGTMGEALMRLYPWIDIIVRGEAENVAPTLFKRLLAGEEVVPQPGLCLRRGADVVCVPEVFARAVSMEDVPLPDYNEFFWRFRRSRLHSVVQPQLLYETSRGCWWGAKAKCTFCGRRWPGGSFRARRAETVERDMGELARRHGVLDFEFVDDILSRGYFRDLLPMLSANGRDYAVWCETKAILKKEYVQLLAGAGFRRTQAGIESLSTPVLRAMKKGVTGLQNVRFLKWCLEFQIRVTWNFIYGVPGEDPAEYERMADGIRSLTHLRPPWYWGPVRLDRFNSYCEEARTYGIEVLGPPDVFRFVFPVGDRDLRDLVTHFEYRFRDGQEPDSYIGNCVAALCYWKENHEKNYGALDYVLGPGFLDIRDRRTNRVDNGLVLEGWEQDLYLACDGGAHIVSLARLAETKPGYKVSVEEIRRTLNEWVHRRLVFQEGERYLALAVHRNGSG